MSGTNISTGNFHYEFPLSSYYYHLLQEEVKAKKSSHICQTQNLKTFVGYLSLLRNITHIIHETIIFTTDYKAAGILLILSSFLNCAPMEKILGQTEIQSGLNLTPKPWFACVYLKESIWGQGPGKVGKEMGLKVEVPESQVMRITLMGDGIALHEPSTTGPMSPSMPARATAGTWGPSRNHVMCSEVSLFGNT